LGLAITPITLKEAMIFVDQVHRHHKAPQGGLFAIAVSNDHEIVGVGIVGRPVARHNDDSWTVEVTRIAVKEGNANACSMLYGASWRTAKALGYKRAITYTLFSEKGTSVKASGWKCIGSSKGGSWNSASRPRIDKHPLQMKLIWEKIDRPGS
tara:strand:- start:5782 stop:6240 length:459 start_codon:yes stop_codon:yes gene_type:complete